MTETILFAGQYTLDAIDIIQPSGLAIDIREQVEQITVYEDIFSPFLSGNIVLADARDLPSFLMRMGVDILRLRIWTPTIDKEKRIDRYFHIYKMEGQQEISDRSQTYVIHFISQESLVDSSITISKTFKSSGAGNIGQILTESLLSGVPFNSSGASNDLVYTSNFWTPTKNIRYNCENSVADDNTASFVFFENRYGFNFKPLTEIASKPIMQQFLGSNQISTVTTGGIDNGEVVKNLVDDWKVILSYTIPVTFDYIKDKANGMLNTRMHSYDYTTKKIKDITFNMNQDTHKLMNGQRFYSEQVIDTSYRGSVGSIVIRPQYEHSKLYDDSGGILETEYRQGRMSIMRQFQQHKIEIEVLGRTDYTVGETVLVDLNRLTEFNRQTPRDQISNPLHSGKYIIGAVCHRFTRDGKHLTKLELMRDSIRKYK